MRPRLQEVETKAVEQKGGELTGLQKDCWRKIPITLSAKSPFSPASRPFREVAEAQNKARKSSGRVYPSDVIQSQTAERVSSKISGLSRKVRKSSASRSSSRNGREAT